MTPVYTRILGARMAGLAPELQALHGGYGQFQGRITVKAPTGFPLRQVCQLLGFPKATENAAFTFSTEQGHIGDIWNRRIGDHVIESQLWATSDGFLAEKLGSAIAVSEVEVINGTLRLQLLRMRMLGLTIPMFLAPRISTSEQGVEGKYLFDVSIRLPFMPAPLVRYYGFLDIADKTPA